MVQQYDYSLTWDVAQSPNQRTSPTDNNSQMVTSYPHQKSLLAATVVFSSLFWLGLVLLAHASADRYFPELGREYQIIILAVIVILIYAVLYLRNAGRVAYLRGHAVEIGPKQYPDLHARLKAVCKRLNIENLPVAYLYQNARFGNSFSLRFHGKDYLALNGELIGALTDRQGAIDFYMGYELGRIHDRYARWVLFLFPATVLPLLGPASARANIYTYDRYGLAASKTNVDAAYALAVWASGSRRWKSFNVAQFAAQSASSRGFWMSSIELISATPSLSKRIAHLRAIATNSNTFIARGHPLAYLTAGFIPYLAARMRGGPARALCILLWAAVITFTGNMAYQQLARSGVLELLESRFENKVVSLPGRRVPSSFATTAAINNAPSVKEGSRTYKSLDADLKLLGRFALVRYRKHGGIPCEIGNIVSLKLNHRAERYAFSCSEPNVYTIVEAGEFEAGRPSYLRTYNWKQRKLIQGWPETPPAAP